ncbi:MAG: SDR family NAD(P)-dependent oxidoreductase [Mycobacteriales bacterium]
MRLEGARVLLTGADGGIGSVLAPRLVARGADLVLSGLHADRLAREARALSCEHVPWALCSAADAFALGEKVGPVDVVVHGAGLGHRGPMEDMAVERLDELVTLDLTVPIALTRAVLPDMLDRGAGHVCFVGSIAGQVAVAEEAAYAAAKGGLAVFADSLRLEVGRRGVEVSVVAPAAVDTEFFARRGVPYHRRHPGPMDPDRVARAIVRAVERAAPRTIVPGWMAAAVAVRGAAPRLYDRLARRFDG